MLVKERERELSVTRCKNLHTTRKAASRVYNYLRPIIDVMSFAGIGVSMYIRFCGKGFAYISPYCSSCTKSSQSSRFIRSNPVHNYLTEHGLRMLWKLC